MPDGCLTKSAQLIARVETLEQYYALRKAVLLPAQIGRLLGEPEPPDCAHLSYRPFPEQDLIHDWSVFELGNYVRNTLSRDADVFGRAHDVELRAPYLDHRVVGAILRVPGSSKIDRRQHKPLLQAAVGGALPRFTWDRPKMGFTLPFQNWLREEFVPRPTLDGYCDADEVRRISEAFFRGSRNPRSWTRYWALCVLERFLAEAARG